MSLSLAKLIARTQAAIDGETDAKKLRPLQANLAAFLVAKSEMDGGDGGDGGDDGDDDEEPDSESKAKLAAKAAAKARGKAEAAKHRAKAAEHKAKAAESEEAAKKAESEEDDEEEEEAEEAAAAAAPAHEALLTKLARSVQELKDTQATHTKAALIAGARKLGAVTKTEAAWLGAQALPSVETFLEMRSKAGLVAVDEETLLKPKHVKPGTEESLPAETLQMIEAATNVWTGDKKAYREELVKAHLAAHAKSIKDALSGAGAGRY